MLPEVQAVNFWRGGMQGRNGNKPLYLRVTSMAKISKKAHKGKVQNHVTLGNPVCIAE